jgi:hypothetical protein
MAKTRFRAISQFLLRFTSTVKTLKAILRSLFLAGYLGSLNLLIGLL